MRCVLNLLFAFLIFYRRPLKRDIDDDTLLVAHNPGDLIDREIQIPILQKERINKNQLNKK